MERRWLVYLFAITVVAAAIDVSGVMNHSAGDEQGPATHAQFVRASYGAVAVAVVGVLLWWLWRRGSR